MTIMALGHLMRLKLQFLGTNTGLDQLLTAQWAVLIGVMATFCGFAVGNGVTALVFDIHNGLLFTAFVIGLAGLVMYCVWLVVFFRRAHLVPPVEGAMQVELQED